ncbi:MAG: hypothetical protein WKF63_04650 [Thermomicrobiales bacterium]
MSTIVLGIENQARNNHCIRAEEDELVHRFAAVPLLAVDVLRRVEDDDDIARTGRSLNAGSLRCRR